MKWLIGLVVLLLAAFFLESSLLAYTAYVLLGTLVLSRLLARSWTANLSVGRLMEPDTAEVGETVEVQVTVRNHGWLPVPWVLIEDLLPARALAVDSPRLKVKGKRLQLRMVRGGGTTRLAYQIRPIYRGYYQIGPLLLESGDLFGLHRRYRIAADPHYLLVYPKVMPLEGYELASRRPIGEVRLTHRLYEDPTRIAGVRGYQAGDPLNRVHWRATARAGTLHSKVYEPSTLAGATLVVDFHQGGYPARGEPVRSELAITAAASLANAISLLGQQVGLVTNGRDAADRIRVEGWHHEDYRTRLALRQEALAEEANRRLEPLIVPTGRGPEQFHRIREVLARLELTDGLSLAELVGEASGRLPRHATVTALLPAVSPETAIALGNLRRQGFAVSVILLALSDDLLAQAHGRLLSEGVRDVRHLASEAGLPALCSQQVGQTTPYALAVPP